MYVHSLHLENIKAFDKLELEFARSSGESPDYAGMNVFVGGNSSGKSTILKSIAMALSGPTVANQQLISPVGWIRESSKRGTIELKVVHDVILDAFRQGGRPPASNTFDAGLVFDTDATKLATTLKRKDYRQNNDTKIQSADRGPWHPETSGWLLGGYGPLRRLTGSSAEAMRYSLGRGKLATCVTLFREDAALSESELWLRQEHARALEQRSEQRAASTLVEQLQSFLNGGLLPPGFAISKISVDDVLMSTPNGGDLPMRDLSDGCRSAFALILDIVHSMTIAYPGNGLFEESAEGTIVLSKPGVVLIDELEAHLHPSWQRLVCEWLKSRFPRVQFFVTTHSPLIVQAADNLGVFVLPLPQEIASGRATRRLTEQEQERIAMGTAEKVLLGEAFGLKNTWSQRANRTVAEWQRLAALRNANGALRPEDNTQYVRLSKEVAMVFDEPVEGANA